MSRILFYLLLKPLSYLPFSVLYRVSDVLFVLLYRIFGFRTKVVLNNLNNSFPEKSEEEINHIAEEFYRHLCDIIVEAIRMFSIPKEELLRRCPVVNPEIFDHYAAQGKSVLLVAGHYNNWELAAVACGPQIVHQTAGIYHPLSNAFMNERALESRSRFGLKMISKKEVKPFFEENKDKLTATMFGADQSPSNSYNAYWTTFLNQDTAVLFGTEKYAKEYDYPVIFGTITKLRRGYYQMSFHTLEDHPADSAYGSISEQHTRALEELIIKAPQYWLWTHKRWKRKRPSEMEARPDSTAS